MDIDTQLCPGIPSSKYEQINNPKQSLTCKPKILYNPESANTFTDAQPQNKFNSYLQQTNNPTQTLDCSYDINYNPKAVNTMNNSGK